MSVQLLRNTRLWVTTGDPDASPARAVTQDNTWEVLLQDDFSFNQDSNSTDITLNEAGPRPTRGSARFNDSLNPADWNFSTYLRPYLDTGGDKDATNDKVLTPDYALWHSLASGSPLDITGDKGVTTNKTNMLVKFTDNQYHELTKVTLYYLVDTQWYKVENVQINQAEISIDIDGIGTTAWSGQGTKVIPLGKNTSTNAKRPFDPAATEFTMPDSIFNSASYIKNKLTTLYLTDITNPSSPKEYDIAITGGTITINNNISYLTPSTLSRLDTPIGSFTGSFEVTGSLEAYLRSEDYHSGTKNYAADLLQDQILGLGVTNKFKLAVCLGGVYTTASPGVVMVLPTAQVSVPSIETADVLGTTIEFKGVPTTLDAGDEIYLGFSPKYTKPEIDNLILSGDGNNNYIPDPTITTQPTNESLNAGTQLSLTVAGTNIARTQWYHNDVPIPSATGIKYTKARATAQDAGKYKVIVYNTGGEFLESNEVTITIN